MVKYIGEKEKVDFSNFTVEKNDTILLYLGGMYATKESTTYTTLQKHFKNIEVEYVDYDRRNAIMAKEQIKSKIIYAQDCYKNVLLCGNSLGGYWANYFSEKMQIPCILINPSLFPKTNLEKYEMSQETLHEFEESTLYYKNKRALFGRNDEIVNNKLNEEKLQDIKKIIWVDDGHRLTNCEVLIDLISLDILPIKNC